MAGSFHTPGSNDVSGLNSGSIQQEMPSEPTPAPHMQRVQKAAWEGHISDGLLQQVYFERRAEYAAQRAGKAARLDALSERYLALIARLQAIIHQPDPPKPEPREPIVLRPTIVPFVKGVLRRG